MNESRALDFQRLQNHQQLNNIQAKNGTLFKRAVVAIDQQLQPFQEFGISQVSCWFGRNPQQPLYRSDGTVPLCRILSAERHATGLCIAPLLFEPCQDISGHALGFGEVASLQRKANQRLSFNVRERASDGMIGVLTATFLFEMSVPHETGSHCPEIVQTGQF